MTKVHKKTPANTNPPLTHTDVSEMFNSGRTVCPGCGFSLDFLAWVDGDKDVTDLAGNDDLGLPAHTACVECNQLDIVGVSQEEYDTQDEATRADMAYDAWKDDRTVGA